MFFDVEPKRRLEDFYDAEEELEAYVDALRTERLVVVKGLRRYGKTSLVLTGLSTLKDERHIFVDCRLLPANPTLQDFVALVEQEADRKSWVRRLLRRVEHVEIGGAFRVRLRGGAQETLARVFEALGHTIVVFDEAQRLRYLKTDMAGLLAYLYDHTKLRIVVTGSEVGVLERFLGVGDPHAPLYGRPQATITLRPLPREKAVEFLTVGFEQAGKRVERDLVEKAADTFGGVIGWLTYFGHENVRRGATAEAVLEEASKLALSELEAFLDTRGAAKRRYLEALRTMATLGEASWSNIKARMDALLGGVPERRLADILKNLVEHGFAAKTDGEYRVADPILQHALKKADQPQNSHPKN